MARNAGLSRIADRQALESRNQPPWQRLYLTPLPHGQRSLRPIFLPCDIAASTIRWPARLFVQSSHVQAAG